MRTTHSGRHMIDFLFTLALFCVFAASSLLVVVIGANVYQSTVFQMEKNYDTNTSLAYVATKIRQHDASGAVYTANLGDTNALVLEQQIGEQTFQTWIYHHEGSLHELFTQKGNAESLTPSEGQPIVPIEDFSVFFMEDGLLCLISTDDSGNHVQQFIHLRSHTA